jgi:hypothetical protein
VFSDLISKERGDGFTRIQSTLDGLFSRYAPEEVCQNLSSGCMDKLLPRFEIFFELLEGFLGAITATNIYNLSDNNICTAMHLISRLTCAVISGVSLASAVGTERSIKRYLCSAIADKHSGDIELLDISTVSQHDEQIIRQVASSVAQRMHIISSELNEKDQSMLSVLQKLIAAPVRETRCGVFTTIAMNVTSVLTGVTRAIMEVIQKNSVSTKSATIVAYAFESAATVSIRRNAHYKIEENARLAMMTYISDYFIKYVKNRYTRV